MGLKNDARSGTKHYFQLVPGEKLLQNKLRKNYFFKKNAKEKKNFGAGSLGRTDLTRKLHLYPALKRR